MKKLSIYPLSLLLFLFVPMMVSAQTSIPSKTEKLFLNLHFNADRLNPEDGDAVSGGGMGIKAGYGFSKLFTLYVGVGGANMSSSSFAYHDDESNDFGLGYAEIGAQFNFQTSKPAAIPYIDVALTERAAVFDQGSGDDLTLSGGGFSFGGGLKYFVSKTLALDLGLEFTVGKFDKAEIGNQSTDIDEKASSSRLNFGLSWFPFNK